MAGLVLEEADSEEVLRPAKGLSFFVVLMLMSGGFAVACRPP